MTAPAVLRPQAQYRTTLTRDPADVAAAQRLRHDVFALECGATLDPGAALLGMDVDEWDEHCDHLVVRDEVSDRVVGTYRLLPPERAAAVGRCYGDGEFDLTRHTGLRSQLVEAGRSCVHPDHRNGAVINQLWGGLARYVLDRGYGLLGGCASVSVADGGATAAGVWDALVTQRLLAPAGLWVAPHVPFDLGAAPRPARLVMPPLLRAYLKIGGRVCGRPAYDADFGTADFYVLLDMAAVDPRILRHLLGAVR